MPNALPRRRASAPSRDRLLGGVVAPNATERCSDHHHTRPESDRAGQRDAGIVVDREVAAREKSE
jgi:hypothetical protein